MYRDLLVHVDGGSAGRGRVQFALALAERMDARLNGIHVTPPAEVPPLYKPSLVSEVAAKIASDLALNARNAATIFGQETDRRTMPSGWLQLACDVVRGISDQARYADLVILGQDETQGSPERHPLPIAHSVVLQCGRPVLVVPAAAKGNEFANIAVAWDGSREAVRAVHDALPLLHLSQSVHIVTMMREDTQDGETDTRRVAAHLIHHGIKVGPNVLKVQTVKEHESLREQIEQGHYDLLVMGAYSHPKWLEFVFGGATQSILSSSTIPVLVSH